MRAGAVDFYRLDNSSYPSAENGLRALVERPSEYEARNWPAGGYMKRLPIDPWGREYVYRYPGVEGAYDILTFGRDGNPGGDGEDEDLGSAMRD